MSWFCDLSLLDYITESFLLELLQSVLFGGLCKAVNINDQHWAYFVYKTSVLHIAIFSRSNTVMKPFTWHERFATVHFTRVSFLCYKYFSLSRKYIILQ